MGATLEEIRNLARGYADQVNSAFRSDDDLDRRINISWAKLYGLLVKKHEDFFEAETDIALVSGQGAYDLSAIVPAVRKLRGVSYLLSDADGDEHDLPTFQWGERAKWSGSSAATLEGGARDYRYCWRGNKLEIRPVPDGGGTLRLYYVPRRPTLVEPPVAPAELADDEIDELPHVVEPGWEEFVARDAAASLLLDEQNPDATVHLAVVNELRKEIEGDSDDRDADAPRQIVMRVSYEDD